MGNRGHMKIISATHIKRILDVICLYSQLPLLRTPSGPLVSVLNGESP